jgi:sugar phosphate isomerase/epimerase
MATATAELPIAVQLYTLRTLPASFDEVLGQVAAVGYTAVETVGDHGLTSEAMGGLLAKHGLRVISTHLQLDALRERAGEIIAFNQAIGNDTLVVPYIPALRASSDAATYREHGQVLGELARQCKAEGMQLLYHNHNWEMQEFEGRRALDLLFEAAGPALGFEPDLAWIAAADLDPAALLARYAGRCPRVHAKDLAPKGERLEDALFDGIVMADVGAGLLDWPSLIPAARAAGAAWFIVEHDNPRDPIDSIARSLSYLRSR